MHLGTSSISGTLVVFAALILSPIVSAQDDYMATLEIYEGSVGCRAGLKGSAAGPLLYGNSWLVDPTGATIGSTEDSTYSTNLRLDFAVQPTVSGTYTCRVRFTADGSPVGGNLQDAKPIYTTPTGEGTLHNAWSGLIPTAYKWRGQLNGAGSFAGREVQEFEGGNDVDTCWWPDSAYAPASGLTGGTWSIDANNQYGDDTVGWHWTMVDYYRSHNRAPCQFETDQIMKINYPGSATWLAYKTNRLKAGFTSTTVWSYRDGQQVSKNW